MDRLSKVKYFLKTKFINGTQVFNSRNLVGDLMANIYNEDGIRVDWCQHYDYIEVFGVTADEYNAICELIGGGHWNGDYEGN